MTALLALVNINGYSQAAKLYHGQCHGKNLFPKLAHPMWWLLLSKFPVHVCIHACI